MGEFEKERRELRNRDRKGAKNWDGGGYRCCLSLSIGGHTYFDIRVSWLPQAPERIRKSLNHLRQERNTPTEEKNLPRRVRPSQGGFPRPENTSPPLSRPRWLLLQPQSETKIGARSQES